MLHVSCIVCAALGDLSSLFRFCCATTAAAAAALSPYPDPWVSPGPASRLRRGCTVSGAPTHSSAAKQQSNGAGGCSYHATLSESKRNVRRRLDAIKASTHSCCAPL